ncbi:MAG TPA: helix-hairpin-helix domain-containing protein [Marinagarivorans sp.]
MTFNQKEKLALLALKGVGPTVVKRLEEIGIHSFEQLQCCQPRDIVETISQRLGAPCWKNSPHANNAIASAIERAKQPIS